MPLPPRDHRISLKDAAALTKRYRDENPGAETAGAFHRDQVLEVLAQAGCVGLRVYYGRKADGSPALVLTGIDGADNDLAVAILEEHFPCPPVCGIANPLNS